MPRVSYLLSSMFFCKTICSQLPRFQTVPKVSTDHSNRPPPPQIPTEISAHWGFVERSCDDGVPSIPVHKIHKRREAQNHCPKTGFSSTVNGWSVPPSLESVSSKTMFSHHGILHSPDFCLSFPKLQSSGIL